MSDWASFGFGVAAVLLNLGWAAACWNTPERRMAVAFVGYALACLAFLYPVVKRLIL